MAEGSSKKAPPSVTVNDDDPKTGYVTLFLQIPGLKIKRSVIGPSKAVNADVTVNIADSEVAVGVTFHGSKDVYEYKKKLPENINSVKSSHKLTSETVILKLCKMETVSWAQHVKYLLSRE